MILLFVLAAVGAATPTAVPCSTVQHCLMVTNLGEPERCQAVMAYANGRWPDNWRIQHRYSQCLYGLGRLGEAQALANRCVDRNPGSYECLYQLGLVQAEQGSDDAATATLERAGALALAQGRGPGALSLLLGLDISREDVESAQRHMSAAWSLAERADTKALLHHKESALAMLRRDPEGAMRHIDQTMKTFPGVQTYSTSRAFVLGWAGRFDEAKRELGAAPPPKQDTFDTETRLWLGKVLAGSTDEPQLKAWVDSHKEEHRAWFLLALQAHLAGRDDAACHLLDEAHLVAGKSLLHPMWATGCVQPHCRLAGSKK
jgi:tetratricopeptide (TPR) repeat protein